MPRDCIAVAHSGFGLGSRMFGDCILVLKIAADSVEHRLVGCRRAGSFAVRIAAAAFRKDLRKMCFWVSDNYQSSWG